MGWLTLGAVSNVWAAREDPLADCCMRAVDIGLGYVELRQGSLGHCEAAAPAGPPWPDPAALAELRSSFPNLGMNLAVEAPYLTKVLDPASPYLRRCAEAARALSPEAPVLRLVDLSPAPALLEHPEAVDELGESVGRLTAALHDGGVGLALENSRQPLSALLEVIARAENGLPAGVPPPRICWDPANQALQTLRPEDPAESARRVPVERWFMFHFKQIEEGAVLPTVCEGELDWAAIVENLRERGYRGPALFEIPAHERAWKHLEASLDYVRGLLPP